MSWWWGSSPGATMTRIKGKQFLYIFALAFWDLFQIWEFWLDFDMIWFGKCWLWLIPLLGWLSCGQTVVGMADGVTKEYEEEWALWLSLIYIYIYIYINIYFFVFWFEVEESQKWVCKLCWFYLRFLIAMDSKTRLVLVLVFFFFFLLTRQDWGLLIFLGFFLNFSGFFNFCWQGHGE